MTIDQFNAKIDQLNIVVVKATGLRLIKLSAIISDLETARVELITEELVNLDMSNDDVEKLEAVADAFNSSAADIDDANNLIDTAISIGSRLVSLVT